MPVIPVQTMKAPFDTISANNLDIVWTASTPAGDTFAVGGRDILLAYNSDGVNPYTFTVVSEVDENNRTGNLGPYTLQAGEVAYIPVGLTNKLGWKNASTQLITLQSNNAAIKYGFLRLPAGYP